MAKENETITGSAKGELVITRTFNAPRKLVWQAWTEPAHYKKWWGPKDYTCPVAKIDFRVGGKYHASMKGPDGAMFWSTGTYKEIIPLKKIVFTDSFSDEAGNVVHASQIGMPGEWPEVMEVTLLFEDDGPNTKMTLKHVGLPKEMGEMTNAGWNQSFDKLAATL